MSEQNFIYFDVAIVLFSFIAGWVGGSRYGRKLAEDEVKIAVAVKNDIAAAKADVSRIKAAVTPAVAAPSATPAPAAPAAPAAAPADPAAPQS